LSSGAVTRRTEVAIDDAIMAGWTGRDPAAVEKHIREFEALGVKRPASTPIFYRVAAAHHRRRDRGGRRQFRRRGRVRPAAA
jgi:hypothetical protein